MIGGFALTASERILQILDERNISQKEFSEKTGIPQSTISDWRKKKTNPAADKILIICSVLEITPEWLLSGIEEVGNRSSKLDYYIVHKDSDYGELLTIFGDMTNKQRERVIGYIRAIMDLTQN